MSRISKKKLIEILKGEEENTSQLFNKDWVEGLYDEGQWIKGYKGGRSKMLTIKELTVKNFMSVGNQTQAVDFDQQQLTLVLGENLDQGGDDSGSRNGTGKTTIINALSYALYGLALTNIKRNNLINKTNGKGMVVTLQFEKDATSYRVERGRGPNFLKFYVNDQEQELIDESQGDSRKTQETINELLGMSHDMFKHIVALNTYTEPFLSMRTNDQRAIIEQLLGITILTEKSNALKDKIKETKDAITQETLKIEAIETSTLQVRSAFDARCDTLECRKIEQQFVKRQMGEYFCSEALRARCGVGAQNQ